MSLPTVSCFLYSKLIDIENIFMFFKSKESGFSSANFDFSKSGKKKNKKTQTSHDEKYCARGGCGGVAPFSFIPLFLLDFNHFYGPGQKHIFEGELWAKTRTGFALNQAESVRNGQKCRRPFIFSKHTQFSRQLKAWCFSMECFSFFSLSRRSLCPQNAHTNLWLWVFGARPKWQKNGPFSLFEGIIDCPLILE